MNWVTPLTETLGIRYPIIQGGLAYLARAELAAAVSNAGGLGQITATTLDGGPQQLAEEIGHYRALAKGPFGVNFAIGHRPIEDLLDAAVAEGAPVISLTGGNPAPYVDRAKRGGARLMVLVAGVRAAKKAESLGADVVIAVGQEGGGHIGRDDVGTFVLTRRVVESVRIPVVASGGVADGLGLLASLALGASGVEMGTRLVATQESMAHSHYKAALIAATEADTQVIERTLGRPGRVLPSRHVGAILAAEQSGVPVEELLPLVAGEVNRSAAVEGNLDQGFAWAGQATGLIDDIPTVKALVERMLDAAEERHRILHQWIFSQT